MGKMAVRTSPAHLCRQTQESPRRSGTPESHQAKVPEGASHSPPLRGVAGGGQKVIAEGAVDGTEDLQVVDDTLWGQVVLQCGRHHRAGHVLSINRGDVSDPLGLRVPQFQLQLYSRYWRVIPRTVMVLTSVP